jgi:hypothetical protein
MERAILSQKNRRFGDHPSKRESTVCDIDAYNGITAYLSDLRNTPIETFEDIVAFNDEHSDAEGAKPGDNPAFPTGQVRTNLFTSPSTLSPHGLTQLLLRTYFAR